MQAGERLATSFGSTLEKLSLQARGELKQVSKAIGETAYCQIMAGLELGKRLASQRTAELVSHCRIRNTSDALAYCKEHFMRLAREAKQEEFHIVLLDEKHHVIKSEQITVGLLDKSLVHPREVFKPAVRESACAVILVHNHPSGDPTPSQDDKNITKDLKKAAETLGLRILDHIILSKDRALSMAEEKIL
jgi:DNA repair protein RadC